MKAVERLAAYREQNGAYVSLTAKQRRRVHKKAGHSRATFERNMMVIAANLTALKAAGVDLGHGDEVMTEPAAQCPRCRASGDEVCKTTSGSAAKSPHAGRVAA